MNQPPSRKPTPIISLVFLALLILARSASATLTVTTDNLQGTANTWPFTPSWTVNTNDSLIAGVAPSTALGNFSLEIAGRTANSLTLNTNLTIGIIQPSTTTSSNYVTCGNGSSAGSLIVYTLPTSANGYNLTNITVYGGWANNGRDAQGYTVLYSTTADPASFKYLTSVNYNPSVPANTASANREIINDSLGGLIAANVAAVAFDYTVPRVENGYVGYAAITVGGTAAASVASPVIAITTANQSGSNPFTPTWTLETPNLIAGLAPSTATGNFTVEATAGTPILTDGVIGNSGDVSGFATCGTGGGTALIYSLTNVVNGTDVTNIVVYSGWGNGDRDGQYYILSYSTIAAPTTYIPISTVYYNPQGVIGASANRVAVSMSDGTPLASAVANLKFDFSSPPSANQFDNAYSGVSEIIVQGKDTTAPPPPPSPYLTQDTLPSHAETVVGDQVVFTAAYSNFPPASLQWQFVSGGVTNDIAGATDTTLTLNDVQLTNSGSYQLKAVNATNGSAAPSYSRAAPLAVGTPATVGGVIVQYAGQTGPSDFYPAWTINTNLDLIFGFPTDGSGSPGTATAGTGNYGVEAGLNGDPTILGDGDLGNAKSVMVSCGPGGGSGLSMTYTLDTSSATNGFDLTNIVVYGGWPDDGRNEQKYQVLYSTVAAPSTFSSIGTFDYNPSFTSGEPNATRVTLIPATGVLAQNVYAVQINWNLQGAQPKNGWEGYSEITVGGTPSAPKPVLTQGINPLTARDVVGGAITITAAFSGADSYQWQKDGTNIDGATNPTLTLSNLQLSDTATNGGYRLTAANAAGTAMSRGCSLIVDPTPTAVGNARTAFALQTSDAGSFTPTWDTSGFASSLIYFGYPSDYGPGDFNDPDGNSVSHDLAGGLGVLTDDGYGAIVDGGTHPAFATCGPNAGQFVTYTLPASDNGYDITNIVLASGWNDGGRDADWATVSYSTTLNPDIFLPIAVVTNNPPVSTKSVVRATIIPVAGLLASNAYAIKVDFTTPSGIPNGYSGFSQVNIFGQPSASAATGPVITAQHEETTDALIVETPNLIANQLPSSYGAGDFTLEGCNETNLTDGVIGFGFAYGASCGGDGLSVPYIIFNSASGWDLTNIVVYSLWHDYGRDGQFYNLSYSTLSAPTTFLPLATVDYNPFVPQDGRASGNRVSIAPPVGQTLLASNVAAVKFDFSPQGTQDFGWSGYSEIVLQGSNLTPPTLPVVNPVTVSGGNLIMTGSGGTPNYGYTVLTTTNLMTPLDSWTVSISGVTDGTGAFSNAIPVSASQAGSYFRLRMP